jgi:hypothetical protein
MRVLTRHGLTEPDIKNMTEDERARSTLGGEMMDELHHSDWAKEQREIESRLRTQEDEIDVAGRRRMVLAENARAEFPFPPKKVRSLLRRRRKVLEGISHVRYWYEMFGGAAKDRWSPTVDEQALLKSMCAEAIHKQAFYEVERNEQFHKAIRRQQLARIVCDVPKYTLIGVAAVGGLFVMGVAADLLSYLPHTPTVVIAQRALSRLWNWLFTDRGLVTALIVAIIVVVFMAVRRRLMKFGKDAV